LGDAWLEAVIRSYRPILAIANDRFGSNPRFVDTPIWSALSTVLEANRPLLDPIIKSVGRIDLANNIEFPAIGTGWIIAADAGGVLANAFKGTATRFCVVSFTSDWLFPTSESRAIVHALNASSARVSFAEIVTDKGHDAFLLDEPELFGIVRGFLDGASKARGLGFGELPR